MTPGPFRKPSSRAGAIILFTALALQYVLVLASGGRPPAGSIPGERHGSRAEAALELARAARGRYDYARALRLLDELSRELPNSAEVLAEYGAVYLMAEQPDRARLFFDSALKNESSCVPAIIGGARVCLVEHNFTGAEQKIRRLLAHNSISPEERSQAYSTLARVFLENNLNSEAQVEAERALALDDRNADACYILAFLKASERKPGEVRTLARRTLEIDPFNSGARRLLSQYVDGNRGYQQTPEPRAEQAYERGLKLETEGNIEAARIEFEYALRIQPRFYRALIALGGVMLRFGDYERAAQYGRFATEAEPEGAIGHLELSYACFGIQERARLEIGGTDFRSEFYSRRLPPVDEILLGSLFPDYKLLSSRQQSAIKISVGPLAAFLPALARSGARYYFLPLDRRVTEIKGFENLAGKTTFDGRYYASIRGVGGHIALSGIEHLDSAARAGYNAVAHEFAHQVQSTAMGDDDLKSIRKLYQKAVRESRSLDYYAATNEYEYFAQGYEAYVSLYKRPAVGITARHTRKELMEKDPEFYRLLVRLEIGEATARQRRLLFIYRSADRVCRLTSELMTCQYGFLASDRGESQFPAPRASIVARN
jgi:tetratricopeptide (TPR) repeat protein